ncbi:MAG: HAMP domain-containing sensor histidine kinase [Actinomycetes bacterium]
MTEADPSVRDGALGAAHGATGSAARSTARERQSHVRHDLRSPLAVMYPLLSLLLGESAGELTPKQREYVETMERNVERLERLLVSAMESGWMDCSPAPTQPSAVSLHQVAEEAIALALRDGPGDQEILVSGDAPPAVADREDVRLIVGALLRNAATHGRAGGSVEIVLGVGPGVVGAGDDPGETATLTVSDDGPGMPADELERAGEFGFRGAAPLEARTPGLGIGLWVCCRLAERNGGSLHVGPSSAGGLAATVTLPVGEGSPT